MQIARFTILAAVLSLLAAASVGAQSTATIRLATLPGDTGAEPFYAQDLGFFKAEGLDVEVQTLANGAAIIPGVLSGTIDVGFSNIFSLAQAHERGLPVELLFPGSMYDGRHPATRLVVNKDSSIRTARDLEGKTISVPGVGTLTQLAPYAWVDRAGGNAASLHFVELPSSEMFIALQNHRVDAAEVAEPWIAEHTADVRVLAPGLDGVAQQFVSGGFFTSRQWAAANPSVVVRLQNALKRAAIWANSHQRESALILTKYAKVDPNLIDRMVRTPYAQSVVLPQMQIEIDVAAQYHYLDHSFPISDMLSPTVK